MTTNGWGVCVHCLWVLFQLGRLPESAASSIKASLVPRSYSLLCQWWCKVRISSWGINVRCLKLNISQGLSPAPWTTQSCGCSYCCRRLKQRASPVFVRSCQLLQYPLPSSSRYVCNVCMYMYKCIVMCVCDCESVYMSVCQSVCVYAWLYTGAN